MNFKSLFPEADLTSALISASLLYQSQNTIPLINNLGGLYKNPPLQSYQNPLSQLLQQPFPMNQLKIPATMIANDPLPLDPLRSLNPLLSNQFLNSYHLPQLNQANLAANYHNGLNGVQRTFQDPQLVPQATAKMLSNLLEKYKQPTPTETLFPSNTSSQLTPTATTRKALSTQPTNTLIKLSTKRPRRKANEIERTHKCPMQGCEKSYGSEASMLQHFRLKHPEFNQGVPTTTEPNQKEGRDARSEQLSVSAQPEKSKNVSDDKENLPSAN